MSTTEMATAEPSFPILSQDLSGLLEAIHENLDGEDINPFDLTRIKVPSGGGLSWQISSLDGEEDESRVLKGVILAQRPNRSYWETSLEEGAGPPDCFSTDGITGQGNPGGNCESCPLAQFGSSTNGRQACKKSRLLFFLREDEMFPSVVSIPPTGLKVIKRYLLDLGLQSTKAHSVVTELRLSKEKNSGGIDFSRVVPKLSARLSPEQAEAMEALAKDFQPLFGTLKVMEEKDLNEPTDITTEE